MPLTESEYLQIKRYHTDHADKRDLKEIIECCMSIFNSAVGCNFLNAQNLKVEFFHLKNGITVYEQFCKQYFPSYFSKYHDDYTKEGYMGSFVAQAFINCDVYGILCSLDADVEPNCWYEIILHEMAHIYCITHETDGGNFFEKYCFHLDEKGKAEPNGTMAAGYTVWREFIAYYLGAELAPFSSPLSLARVREKVRDLEKDVDMDNPDTKMLVSQILAHIFQNPTVRRAENAATVYEILEKNRIFASKVRIECYKQLIETIFVQLLKNDYWKISPFFIDDLGSTYIGMLVQRRMESLRNG